MKNSNRRLEDACASLEGLSVGDAFGERFFVNWDMIEQFINEGKIAGPPYDFSEEMVRGLIAQRFVPPAPWRFTDDTQMALSIVQSLRKHGAIEADDLARSFGRHYDRTRGYGGAMHQLLPRYAIGADWRVEAAQLFGGQGSFGNGAAMRVAPLGAYFADDLRAAVENARLSARVTHAHPEAEAGAIGIAVATALAARSRGRNAPAREQFLEAVLSHIPESEVRTRVLRARDLSAVTTVEEAAKTLGSGYGVSAQDTVPFVLWCAARCLDDFEEALWLTVAGLGDRDTTCAMVGGIVATRTSVGGIPTAWREAREALPEWPFSN